MKITALYERLSLGDDGREGESNSIKNQKLQLEEYAKSQGFANIRHYTDDDESGRFFDRSGYAQMMEDVENGLIAVCIMKDLTRWGRDHVQVGIAMEVFRKNNVRFIAINHGIDSIYPESLEMAPFINIMSEWYSKDCSKKVKSAYKTKGMSGKPLSLPPYGYKKSPDNKDFWIIDEPAAAIVRRIFNLTLEGKGLYQIACTLSEEKVLVPSHYHKITGNSKWQKNVAQDPYAWSIHTTERIIQRREYCGDIVNFKTSKHIKDKRATFNDESEWVIFENVHEPIIDRTVFENAQRIYKSMKKKKVDKSGKHHPLAGLVYCSHCGGKMYIFKSEKNSKKPYAQCGSYRGARDRVIRPHVADCTISRRILADNLLELVHHTIKTVAEYSKTDKAAFEKSIRDMLATQQTTEIKEQQKRLAVCKSRHSELDQLLNKIYEDNALGKLSEKRYESLHLTYGNEQSLLEDEIMEIQAKVGKHDDEAGRAARFIELVERYSGLEEITQPMILEFIEKIVVHERDEKMVHTSPQKVEIHLNFIGELLLDGIEHKPSPEELAVEERKAKERERNRLRYIKRKESGYYDKYKKAIA
ncbi:MAG: recombinase family protein [Oscillospiraceae bacterium]|nr:recombinase family protein [Oscillospiraceae bacterium]